MVASMNMHTHQLPHNSCNTSHERLEKQYKAILVKQEKQIHALYELQKLTFEKVTWVQKQIKKQNNNNNDLSPRFLL